jgi:membrane-associated protease RseP (regulator of RpoE activity)
MKGIMPNRQALFDIGIAGPFVGLVLTIPTIIIGLKLSEVAIISEIAYAGWVGLFVTALNLLPVGQLDGGHIIYSLFGKNSKIVYYITLGVLGLICIFINPAWTLLFVLLLIFGFNHPPPLDDFTPLNKRRKILGICSLIFCILSFTPVPFQIQ